MNTDFRFAGPSTTPTPENSMASRTRQEPRSDPRAKRAGGSRVEWFAHFAPATVMPLLERACQDLQRRGYPANARLDESTGRLIAELEVVLPGLPAGARPPRLAVTAARPPRPQNRSHDRPLLIEFTGTFPSAGATGGFGGEIDYTTIYPTQLEEKVVEFLDMATA